MIDPQEIAKLLAKQTECQSDLDFWNGMMVIALTIQVIGLVLLILDKILRIRKR